MAVRTDDRTIELQEFEVPGRARRTLGGEVDEADEADEADGAATHITIVPGEADRGRTPG